MSARGIWRNAADAAQMRLFLMDKRKIGSENRREKLFNATNLASPIPSDSERLMIIREIIGYT
jgi:hypothetical protein